MHRLHDAPSARRQQRCGGAQTNERSRHGGSTARARVAQRCGGCAARTQRPPAAAQSALPCSCAARHSREEARGEMLTHDSEILRATELFHDRATARQARALRSQVDMLIHCSAMRTPLRAVPAVPRAVVSPWVVIASSRHRRAPHSLCGARVCAALRAHRALRLHTAAAAAPLLRTRAARDVLTHPRLLCLRSAAQAAPRRARAATARGAKPFASCFILAQRAYAC